MLCWALGSILVPSTPYKRQAPTARNRVLFKRTELLHEHCIRLPLTDARAQHIVDVLRVGPDNTVRVGIVPNGPIASALVQTITVKDNNNTDVKQNEGVQETECIELHVEQWHDPMPSANIRLILALPRPKVLKRLLPILPTLGVDQVLLTGATKVERAYWANALLHDRHRDTIEQLLVQGLEQSTDTRMPSVVCSKSFKAVLALVSGAVEPGALYGFTVLVGGCDEGGDGGGGGGGQVEEGTGTSGLINEVYKEIERNDDNKNNSKTNKNTIQHILQQHIPGPQEIQLYAHPGAATALSPEVITHALTTAGVPTVDQLTVDQPPPRLTVIIGPEGGWSVEELSMLESAGCLGVSLGARVMTTPTAVVAVVAAAAAMRGLAMEMAEGSKEEDHDK